MTVTCGFFNGADRAANATDVCSIFDGLISDGIYDTIGTAFAVTAAGGNFLNLGVGRAWFNHTWTKNDAVVVYEAPAAELLLHRWDRMVLEVDHSDAVRANRIFILSGTPSSTPVLPILSNGPLKFQYSLAKIYRTAGSTSIAQIDITPEQGTVGTPFVNALVEKFDIASILSQYSDRANELIDDLEAAYLVISQTGIPLHQSNHIIGGSDPIPPASMGALPYDGVSSNLLINGGFDVWQRGTSFSAAGYTADRWLIGFNGSGLTTAITQQTFTVGQTDVPNNPTYYLRFARSVAGSGNTYNVLSQAVESVALLAGKTVTLSFYAKTASSINVTTHSSQYFGSGGSSSVYLDAQHNALTTSWVKFTQTISIPSISGKTVGAGSYLSIQFTLPVDTTFTIDIANVQLNYGAVALPFVPRSYADELRLCLRYCYPLSVFRRVRMSAYATNYLDFDLPISTIMRIFPKISNTVLVVSTLAGVPQTDFTFSIAVGTAGGLLLRATKNSHGLTDAYIYVSTLSTVGVLDAEL